MDRDQLLFREVQRFRRPWLWAVILGVLLVLLGTVGSALWATIAGQRPPPGPGLALGLLFPMAMSAALVWLFAAAHLTVEVRPGVVRFRFSPFHRHDHENPIGEIERHEACQYSPLRDYGGWGIRGLGDDRAYNISG